MAESSENMSDQGSSSSAVTASANPTEGYQKPESRHRKKRSMADLVTHIEGILKPKQSRKGMKPHTRVTSYNESGRIFHNQSKERKKRARHKNTQSAVASDNSGVTKGVAAAESDNFNSVTEFEEFIDADRELADVIEECRQLVQPNKASKWSERQNLSHARWEEKRELMVEAILGQLFLEETLCSQCRLCPAFVSCLHCKSLGPICGICDRSLHSKQPFHDRLVWQDSSFEHISPIQSVNDMGRIIEIKKFVNLKTPLCKTCNRQTDEGSFAVTTQKCIVVNLQGRYDLFKHRYYCDHCMQDADPFTPEILIQSNYWPGSMGNVSYIFDEELLIFWDKLKSFMPGTSEAAFLNSLEDISMERNRQGTINKTAFSKCYKEWKFCQTQLIEMQSMDVFECPSCSIKQHSSHVDGNCKLYRYKGSGRRRRTSYYGDLFFCNDEKVDEALQIIYNDSDIGRMPDTESGLCGSTFWKAAQNKSKKFSKLDETGIVMISCRHRIAQKALNMFRGELFGYSYYLHKNFLADKGLAILYTDVACKYSKWLQKIDQELYCNNKYAIGMMHVKGHPAHCEVLFGGLWMENSGFTPGEEDEQIFSYLSRIGATTKYMLPERREETITEHAAAWNRRKLINFVPHMCKRYQNILKKRVELEEEIKQQTSKCNFPTTAEIYESWKEEAMLNAEVAQNSALSVNLTEEEEMCMLYMFLKEKAKLPSTMVHVCDTENVAALKISLLKLKPLCKATDVLQRKYCKLNDKYQASESITQSLSNVFDKVFLLHQRRLEATAYSIIHLTNNLSKIADSSKKRKKIRAKVSRQSELLKTLVSVYNGNVDQIATRNIPRISLHSCLRDSFPWRQQPADETDVSSELKQSLLVLNLTSKRLTEELSLIKLEMKNFILYFKEKKLKEIEIHRQELSDFLSKCPEEGTAIVNRQEVANTRYDTSKMTANVLRGKMALNSQGMRYCQMQIARACSLFQKCIGDAATESDWLSEELLPDETAGSDSGSDFGDDVENLDQQELMTFSDPSSSDSEEEFSN